VDKVTVQIRPRVTTGNSASACLVILVELCIKMKETMFSCMFRKGGIAEWKNGSGKSKKMHTDDTAVQRSILDKCILAVQ